VGKSWTGRLRGGRIGNTLFTAVIRSPLYVLTPVILFFVSFYFIFASPVGTRASFELADRLGRGGNLWRRFFFLWRHNYMYGTLLVDRFAIVAGKADRYTFERPDPAVIAPLEQGRGMIFLTAHLGSWDVMGQMLVVKRSIPVNLVMHVGLQPELRALIERGRQFKVIETDGSPATAAALLERLSEGEIVAMMGDRVHEAAGVEVEFLGGTVRIPAGPFALAAMARAPMVYAFAVRSGPRRYRFVAEPVGELRYTDRRNKQNDHKRWAQAFATRLEELVREDPFQWGNFFSVWETKD
jgi:predicted LPLAT superfamily acyltransferase